MSRSKPTIVLQERQCSYCGSYFRTDKIARSVVCEECHALRKSDQQREYQAKRRYNLRKFHFPYIGYHIVHEPDPVYGYPIGATFPKEEVRLMMTIDCHAFTPGTIIADIDGHHYLIVSKPNGGLKKVPCQNEQTQIKN